MSTKQNHNLPFDEDNGCFPPMSDEEFAAAVEAENSPAAKRMEELKEALRKAILWAEGASRHITDREGINWTYLEEARRVLDSQNARGDSQPLTETMTMMKAQPTAWRLFSEKGVKFEINIQLIDDGGGDYIQLESFNGSVSFEPNEWGDLRNAIDHAILHIKPEKQ